MSALLGYLGGLATPVVLFFVFIALLGVLIFSEIGKP